MRHFLGERTAAGFQIGGLNDYHCFEQRQARNHAPAGHEGPGGRLGARWTRYRDRSGGMLPRQKPQRPVLHTGTISGLFLGNFAIVASLTFRCWATIAGGVRVIQSERETSMNWGALNTSRTCRSVSPVFLI